MCVFVRVWAQSVIFRCGLAISSEENFAANLPGQSSTPYAVMTLTSVRQGQRSLQTLHQEESVDWAGWAAMGRSAGHLPENSTARLGIWERGGLYTSCPSKFKFTLEWKQNAPPHVVGPSHFLSLLPSENTSIHHSRRLCIKVCSVYSEGRGLVGLGQLRK